MAQTGKSNQTGLINTNSYILVRLGWYLSPLGMLLGVVGLLRALWKRLTLGTAYFFTVLGIVGVIFGDDTYTVATYPYSLRRFLPVANPGLLILAAYALAWAGREVRARAGVIRPLAWATAGALVVFFLVTGWVIISHTEDAGAVAQIDRAGRRFPDPAQTVLLFSNERDEPYVVATPLAVHLRLQLLLAEPAPMARSKGDDGAGRGATLAEAGLPGLRDPGRERRQAVHARPRPGALRDWRSGREWTYDVPELEQLYTQKPKNISRLDAALGPLCIAPRASVALPALPFALDIGGMTISTWRPGSPGRSSTPRTDAATLALDLPRRLPARALAGCRRNGGGTITLRLSAGPKERAVHAAPPPGTTLRRGEVPDTPLVPAPAQFKLFAGNLRLQPATPTPGATDPALVTLQPGGGFQDVTFAVPPNAPTDPANPNYLMLHLNSTTWSPADAGVSADDRNLGVQVDNVRVDVAP